MAEVRTVSVEDVDSLVGLEELVNPSYRVGRKGLESRVRANPNHTLVLEEGGAIVGVLFTALVNTGSSVSLLEKLRYASVVEHHHDEQEGWDTAFWVHLIVHPKFRRLMDEFHANARSHFFEKCQVKRIYALSHCSNFSGDSVDDLTGYVKNGYKTDRNLYFHSSRGAVVKCVLPEYNENDKKNFGCGVVMEYRSSSLVSGKQPLILVNSNSSVTLESLEKLTQEQLGIVSTFEHDVPWFELGFDSFSLVKFHTKIEQLSSCSLDVSFLFGVNTFSKLLQAFGIAAASGCHRSSSTENVCEKLGVYGVGLRFPHSLGYDDLETCEDFWAALNDPDFRCSFRLQNRDRFDVCSFSGLLSTEQAKCMPLAQRLVLEAVSSALNDAPDDFLARTGRRVGVFVGAWEHTEVVQCNSASVHAAAAFSNSILANRLSFLFDFTGPSLTVDTACSSSLVAMDYARLAIQQGKCEAAVVVGVNVVSQDKTFVLGKANFLSPTERCHSFDDAADGYVRSEGCGAVLIGRLGLGLPSRAVVHSTAVNQDGRTVNLHAPNPVSQIELMRQACYAANIDTKLVRFVESHGTGTKLGDPIEANALNQVYGSAAETCYISAVKAQFGHLEGAAGIIGFIAAVLCLQQRQMYPNQYLGKTNTSIPFESYNVQPVGKVPMALARKSSFGAVSSFGFGGTNAHVVLSSTPAVDGEVERKGIAQYRAIEWRRQCLRIPFNPALEQANVTELFSTTTLSEKTVELLSNHRVGSTSIVPATFMVVLGLEMFEAAGFRDLKFSAMLSLPLDRTIHTKLDLSHPGKVVLQSGSETTVATFIIDPVLKDGKIPQNVESMAGFTPIECATLYDSMIFNQYTGPFHGLKSVWKKENHGEPMELVGHLEVPSRGISHVLLHSIVLDVATHVCVVGMNQSTAPVFVQGIEGIEFVDSSYYYNQDVDSLNMVCRAVKRSDSNIFDFVLYHGGTDSVAAVVTGIEFGVFRQKPPTVYRETWGVLDEAAVAGDPPGVKYIVIDEPDVKRFHRQFLKVASMFEKAVVICLEKEGQLGYIRCARLEYPNISIKSVSGGQVTEEILKTVAATKGEHQDFYVDAARAVHYRGQDESVTKAGDGLLAIKPGGTYLITGGLGALGVELCNQLLLNGAGRVLLLGRSYSDERFALVSNPQKAEFIKCDVSVVGELKQVAKEHRNIAGVFHCAGVLRDATIPNLKGEDFDAVFAPKVGGAKNVLSCFDNLGFLLLFSSITAGYGAAGQANYAAANSVLDALANKHDNVFSIRWGPFRGERSMANDSSERWHRLGYTPMEPSSALGRLFSGCASAKVLTIACISEQSVTMDTSSTTTIEETVVCLSKQLLRVSEVDLDQPWGEAGMDSLMLIEFRNMLQQRLGGDERQMNDTALFDYPTPRLLIAFLEVQPEVEPTIATTTTASSVSSSAGSTTVSVTGAACRLPGGVKSPDDFWTLLNSGHDVITPLPLGRFSLKPEQAYTDRGGFIDDVEYFDYKRFGIPFNEAKSMDPQQRLALSMAHEALTAADLIGKTKKVGVFVGVMTYDWYSMVHRPENQSTAYSASGHCASILANRISYCLGLTGPSLSVDTACSSSLVALDLACSSLSRGDCEAAVVIGVNLLLSPEMYVEECAAKMLSPHGKCSTFSVNADGYVRSEGCVALVVEPQTTVKPVWGEINGTAVNQDGRSVNLTSPSGLAQQEVINKAVERAGISTSQVAYVETHGTGTSLGDPIEVRALTQVFSGTQRRELCLGAVKSIMGHGEGVAGVTSVLKAMLCLQHGYVPGNLNLDKINPKVEAVAAPFMKISKGVDDCYTLLQDDYVGVSGFGFGGTNAHVILSRPQELPSPSSVLVQDPGEVVSWPSHGLQQVAYNISWEETSAATVPIPESFNVFHIMNVDDALEVVQPFLHQKEKVVKLVLVTRNAVTVSDGEKCTVESAMIWGFVRSLRLERPKWRVYLVDTNSASSKPCLLDRDGEFELAIREACYVPRIQPLDDVLPLSLALPRRENLFVITGGSGGIAKEIVNFLHWELKVPQESMICLSRSGRCAIDGVQSFACDVTDLLSLMQFSKEVLKGRVPNYIFHTAGVLKEAPVDSLSSEMIDYHCKAKIDGCHNLLKIFPDECVLVTFSSTSSVLGMKNGAAYSIANSGLDALAKSRNNIVNIQWDMWSQAGMATERGLVSNARGLSTNQACQALVGILQRGIASSYMVISVEDWSALSRATGSLMFDKVISHSQRTISSPIAAASEGDVSLYPKAETEVLTWILRELRNFVQLEGNDSEEDISVTPWLEIGFDSLSMTDFIAHCNSVFSLSSDLADTAMFDFPNPMLFAQHVFKHILVLAPREEERTLVIDRQESMTSQDDDMYVAGMGLRFPGPKTNCSPEGFWDFLCGKGDAMKEITRFDVPKEVFVRCGAFLHPDLFNRDISALKLPISKSEIMSIDPHQKLALEVAVEILENGKSNGADVTKVGVFVGAQNTEFFYSDLNEPKSVNAYTATGTALSIIANRISYSLNLTGPSVTIDTACSSSLVALDAAAKAIANGDCTSAIVLGVDLMLSPHRFQITCAAKMLSPNGRCATFTNAADGYARGEGCAGILITQSCSKHLAKVKSIAVNQDGQSANLTAPRGPAQVECILAAQHRAGLVGKDLQEKIEFIETHGTGTALGDPLELEALSNVFAGREKPLPLGAVKTNIGHLEACAGMAGILKTILCLRKRQLPPNIHLDSDKSVNTRVRRLLKKCNFQFPHGSDCVELPKQGHLLAGVSSFGFGGTNAHVILGSSSDDGVFYDNSAYVNKHLTPAFVCEKAATSQSNLEVWDVFLGKQTLDVIRMHQVGEVSVIPATTYIEVMGELLRRKYKGETPYSMSGLRFDNMLFVNSDTLSLQVHISLDTNVVITSSDGSKQFASFQLSNVGLYSGSLLEPFTRSCTVELPSGEVLYDSIGNNYRGPFQGLVGAWQSPNGSQLLGKVKLGLDLPYSTLPSVWLDVASHVGLAMLSPTERRQPVYAEEVLEYYSLGQSEKVFQSARGGHVWSCIVKTAANKFDMDIYTSDGVLLARVKQFSFGFFQQQKRPAVTFVDTWEVANTDLMSADIARVVNELTVEALHGKLLELLPDIGKGDKKVQVVINDECQLGYLRCFRTEYPKVKLQSVNRTGVKNWVANEPELNVADDGSLRVRRLTRLVKRDSEKVPLVTVSHEHSSYIVTGGLGALGKAVTKELVKRGASRIVLVGRSPVNPSMVLPPRCSYVSCDLGDIHRVRAAFGQLDVGAVKGIFHCAGVLMDAPIAATTVESFHSVKKPKVDGIVNLCKAFNLDLDSDTDATDEPHSLEYVVMFSSIAGGIGSTGQGNYGAANSGLDHLAMRNHNNKKTRVVSIRWGPWAGDGMAKNLDLKFDRLGLIPLSPQLALEAMFGLCCNDAGPVVTICNFKFFSGGAYFARLAPSKQATAAVSKLNDKGKDKTTYTRDVLNEIVLELVDAVNPLCDEDELAGKVLLATPWREIGLDSLSMVEFRNLLDEKLAGKFNFDDTVLFDYPTPNSLVQFVMSQQEDEILTSSSKEVEAKGDVDGVYIIGAACRLPGGVNSPSDFWGLLTSGKDGLSSIPANRFDASKYYNEEVGHSGSSIYTKSGGFVDNVELFDNDKFNICNREASQMDPQQRLALELAYESLTKAGVLNDETPSERRNVGVFVGAMTNDWARMQPAEDSTSFSAASQANCVIANRISYTLGLSGPSMCIDTACSSSLVALIQAKEAIERGDCDTALVLGVNLILAPDLYIQECAARMLSPNGKCSTFSKDADGYVRGEGCVAIVLSSSMHNAGECWGSVLGCAVNQDGRSANLTSPNGSAQQEVITRAISRAGVSPDQIRYVETHGTGTPLGDPLEVSALSRVFDSGSRDKDLVLGAVKTLVGHGEGCAGLTSVLKTLLCGKHGVVPGNLNLGEDGLNPKIDKVKLDCMVFPRVGQHSEISAGDYVGVSSFGFGGTNAHVVLSVVEQQKRAVQGDDEINVEWNRKAFPWWNVDKTCSFSLFGQKFVPGVSVLLALLEQQSNHLSQVKLESVWDGNGVSSNSNVNGEVACENHPGICASCGSSDFASDVELLEIPSDNVVVTSSDSFYTWLNEVGMHQSKQCLTCVYQQEDDRLLRAVFEDATELASVLSDCVGIISLLLLRQTECDDVLWEIKSIEEVSYFPMRSSTNGYVCQMTEDSLSVFTSSHGALVLHCRGLVLKSNEQFGPTCLFKAELQPYSLLSKPRRDPLPLVPSGSQVSKVVSVELEKDLELHRYSVDIIRRVVEELGTDYVPPKTHHQLVYKRWVEWAKEDAVPVEPTKTGGVEFDFLDNCKDSLGDVITGVVEPLDVLFSNPKLTTSLYRDSSPSLSSNLALARAVENIVKMRASQSYVVRILELGAGTGGTTEHFVPFLEEYSEQVEYVFTDISEYFLRVAGSSSNLKHVVSHFCLLDIEQDIMSQGFHPGQFDVVLGSNIVHATRNLGESATNICNLLRPGGVFLLNEATESIPFLDCTFALTEGWWRFVGEDEDRAGQTGVGPLLDVVKWKNLLAKNGFAGFKVLHEASQCQAVMECVREKGLDEDDKVQVRMSAAEVCLLDVNGIKGVEDLQDTVFDIAKQFSVSDKEILVFCTRRDLNTYHACASGVARSLMKELRLLEDNDKKFVVTVDFDESSFADLDHIVNDEISQRFSGCYQISYRNGARFESVLARRRPLQPRAAVIKAPKSNGGTFVVTGGLGGLGLLTAEVLLESGVGRHIVLTSRSAKLRNDCSPMEKQLCEKIFNWTKTEVSVHTFACDIGKSSDVDKLFDFVDDLGCNVQGIIHAAGVVRDGFLKDLSWENDTLPVLNTKISGVVNLARIIQQRDYKEYLDKFVIYSSAAGLFGSACQTNHSAANSFLDEFALKHTNAVAINWGGWSGIGAVADNEVAEKSINQRGMGLITVRQGRRVIEEVLLCDNASNFGVVPIVWEKFARQEVDKRFLAEFYSSPHASDQENVQQQTQRTMNGSLKGDLGQAMSELLIECGVFSMEDDFEDQGLDSLSSIQVISMVRDQFGVKLTPTFYLDCGNGNGLVEFVSTELGLETGATEQQGLINAWVEPVFPPTRRLFCFAYAGGHPNIFQEWLPFIPGDTQICAISMPGFGQQSDGGVWDSVQDLASAISVSLPTDKPFSLVGSCLGAIVGYEVAKCFQNSADTRQPDQLLVIACAAPQLYSQAINRLYLEGNILENDSFLMPKGHELANRHFSKLSENERAHSVNTLHSLGFFKDEVTMKNLLSNKIYFEHVMTQLSQQMRIAQDYQYVEDVAHQKLDIPIVSISGKLDTTIPNTYPSLWGAQSSEFEYVSVEDGGHYIVHTHPNVICQHILARLQQL